jgi:diguanylate cyclase (GGDEF)-like protein/PAS domain S-box-containing protein
MRITTRLQITSKITVAAFAVLVPVLIWSFVEFKRAKNDYILTDAIKVNFFERASFRDQYFLYREDRARVQWDKSKEIADRLLDQANSQFHNEQDRQVLDRLHKNIDDAAVIFHRIVSNSDVLKTAVSNRPVYEELDKRLSSQLLLKAAAVRDTVTALQDASDRRVEQTYKYLTVIIGLFAATLALGTILTSIHLGRLIRKRLVPLHDGARIVAGGDLSYRIQCEGSDEFAELALSINAMTENLQASTKQLEAEIDAHKQAAEMLRKLSIAVEQSPASVIITDLEACVQYANPRFAEITGYSTTEVVGQNMRIFQSGQTAKEVYQALWSSLSSGLAWHGEFINKRKNGELYWEETHIAPVRSPSGTVSHYVALKTDITERKKTEEKLQFAASVFTHAREGIMITAADSKIIDVNDTFTNITGYSRDEVLGQTPNLLSSGIQGKEFYASLWGDLIKNGHWYGEVWNRRKDGEVYAEILTISAVRDAQGNTQHYVALFSDITTLKKHESELERIAHYDALTGLPNRVLLADRLHQGMMQAVRRKQRLAVVYLDLDGFKAINDNHGHEAGDQLLIAVASRMKQSLREGDTLARLGGDEFVAVMPDLADIETSIPMLSRLLTAASQPLRLNSLLLQVSASLGVTFYSLSEDIDADQLLRQADQAMYQAKLLGKNRYHVFDAEQDRSVRGHHESLERIRHALTEREFVLYYQPKVNMRSGEVIGAEALIRWQHPERGLLAPAVFLPVIEDHPLAVELGEWVIDNALTQIERWQAVGLDIPVSVNVGARQLQETNFVGRLRTLLAAHPNVNPDDLELEILETSALEDLAQVSMVINACREIGVTFALDDFGTGYSSLTYLKRLPVTLLKIDQSFVRGMLGDSDDLAILDGVLGLAVAFRRQVIAEGVETVEHGEMLLQLGCELGQGYGIARPMPASEMPAWAAAWRIDPSWANLSSVSRDDL